MKNLILKSRKLLLVASMALVTAPLALVSTEAGAVPPTYITDAITAATLTFTDYITAAAPGVFGIITIVAGLFLVVKMLKKSTH